jgi:hypothetical protein
MNEQRVPEGASQPADLWRELVMALLLLAETLRELRR